MLLLTPEKFNGRLKVKQIVSKIRVWPFTVLALAMPLAACSNAEPTAQPPQPTTSEESSAVQIPNPKDATAIDPCSMLSAQTAAELGLKPEGWSSHEGAGCQWDSKDLSRSVALIVLPDQNIQQYYENKSIYTDYEEVTIAGYPAVRANQGDPAQDGFCDFFLATNDNQLIQASGGDSTHTDACGPAQKALEAAVPNLPAAN